MQKAVTASETVLTTTRADGQELLTQEVKQLSADWGSLSSLVSDTQRSLDKCLTAWNQFNETRERCNTWLADFQNKVSLFTFAYSLLVMIQLSVHKEPMQSSFTSVFVLFYWINASKTYKIYWVRILTKHF